ncbi:putative ADP-ribosylation factor GTPase-activating protein AGD15 [Capsicum chinense]|nr:putative ADP-ribosylation factor GTPase-activating protein AGD15 [Capsicum chinense]
MGNEKTNSYWEAELPPNSDRVGIKNFIHAKYEDKRWIPKDEKEIQEWRAADKVDIVTDLFDMLSMDSPNENGASATSLLKKNQQQKMVLRKLIIENANPPLQLTIYSRIHQQSSSVSTSSLSDKPPKDVKNDIMNLFDKIDPTRMSSPAKSNAHDADNVKINRDSYIWNSVLLDVT